jgi:SAM-dependent methyltransferase
MPSLKKRPETSCPSCGVTQVTRIGSLPRAFHFCALNFDRAVNPGDLMQCPTCSIFFRSPCLPPAELDGLYSRQPASLWLHDGSSAHGRPDFQAILRSIDQSERKVTSILDVGCFTGSLLLFLKQRSAFVQQARLAGIEPSLKAAEIARAAGVEIIANSVLGFRAGGRRFDLIVMTDVFEHLHSSTEVITELARALNPQGRIIMVTGACDSRPFSFWRNRYYYAAMPEHLVFITQRHAEWCAKKAGLALSDYRIIDNRVQIARWGLSKSWAKGIVYLMASIIPAAFFEGARPNWIRRLRAIRGYGMPNIRLQPDHALITMEASSAAIK